MKLNVIDEQGNFACIDIKEGELYLHPGNWNKVIIISLSNAFLGKIPHNPVRFENTIGLVIERTRSPTSFDEVRWHCKQCGQLLYRKRFHVSAASDLGRQLTEEIEIFKNSINLKTCGRCGTIHSHFHTDGNFTGSSVWKRTQLSVQTEPWKRIEIKK